MHKRLERDGDAGNGCCFTGMVRKGLSGEADILTEICGKGGSKQDSYQKEWHPRQRKQHGQRLCVWICLLCSRNSKEEGSMPGTEPVRERESGRRWIREGTRSQTT